MGLRFRLFSASSFYTKITKFMTLQFWNLFTWGMIWIAALFLAILYVKCKKSCSEVKFENVIVSSLLLAKYHSQCSYNMNNK